MLKTRIRRLAAETERTLDRLAAVEAAVAGSGDEDLLDPADIFVAGDPTPQREMTQDATRRRLSL